MQPEEYIIYTVVSHSQLTVYDDILPGTARGAEQSLQGTHSVVREHSLVSPRCHPSLSPRSCPLLPQHLPTCSSSFPIPPPQSSTEVLSASLPRCAPIPPCHPIPTTLQRSRGSQSSPHPKTPYPIFAPQFCPRVELRAPNFLPTTAPS